jgi:hypothetical protein
LQTQVKLAIAKEGKKPFQNYKTVALVKGKLIIDIFRKEFEDNANNPRTKLYKREVLIALKMIRPKLYSARLQNVTKRSVSIGRLATAKTTAPLPTH